MFSMMVPSKLLEKLLLALSILLLNREITGHIAPSLGYDGDERDALHVLRATFNNPFLNNNWTGIHCYMDDPPRWHGIQCNNGRVTGIVLEGMELKGTIAFDALIRFSELSILSLKNNALQGRMMNFSGNQKLARINLSWNKFYGPMSKSLLSLAFLESLQLQNNNLTGELVELNQTTLISFNVSNNNITGSIPSTRIFQLFSWESYLGNPGLCGPPTHNSCGNLSIQESASNGRLSSSPSGNADKNTEKSKNPSYSGIRFLFEKSNNPSNSGIRFLVEKRKNPSISGIRILFLLFSLVALHAVILLCIFSHKKAKKLKRFTNQKNSREEEEEEEEEAEDKNEEKIEVVESDRVVESGKDREKLIFLENGGGFEFSDLLKASPQEIGKGIFGNTYKAILEDGQILVVKILRDLKPITRKEFTRQLQLLADQKHPNLIPPLAGFFSKQQKLLIYRYAEKGSLFYRIHGGRGSKERVPFRWNSRLTAAQGVARALHYLHINSNSRPDVIVPHGNLKSTNVLLDRDDTVLVSDYGLSSLVELHVAVKSMVCFKSPEYITRQLICPKVDVWSYGCLLLELLTGRICANAAPPGVQGVDLCSWVHRAVREEWTAEIFDMEIGKQRTLADGMLELLQIAIRCCDASPDKRPEMVEIMQEIENMKVADNCKDDFITSPDDIVQSSWR